MAGKEKQGKEAEVDFFGDSNVDWLTDEEEQRAARAAAAAASAPPPPPSLRTATPMPGGADDRTWANRVSTPADPKLIHNQPTLIFSDVPTLPPMNSPVAAAARPPVVADPGSFDEAPVSDADPSLTEAETVEVTHARALPGTDLPTGPTETVQVPGPATLLLQNSDVEIVIPTGHATDPGVAAAPRAGSDVDQPTEQAALPPAAAPVPVDTVETVRVALPPPRAPVHRIPAKPPTPPPASWQEVVALLEAERALATPDEAAWLAYEAGKVSLRMLQAPVEADFWFERARAHGGAFPDLHRQQAEARGALQRFSDQEASLVALAEVSVETDRAEAFLEAGLVAWRRRDRPDDAVKHFARAAEARPDDYTSRALLRALLPSLGRETLPRRLALLAEIAALSEGGVRADALVERAAVADELGLRDEVCASLEGALAAEPGHTFAYQRLERALAADPVALAAARAREAERPDQPNVGYWRWREAAAHRAAGAVDRALAALDRAAEAGWRCDAEREALLTVLQDHARVEALLEAAGTGPGGACAAYRLAILREGRGDLEGARRAHRTCLALDPEAAPAAEALVRLDRRLGGESVAGWRERLATASASDAGAIRLRIAELAMAAGAWGEAREALEALTAASEGSFERDVALDLLDATLAFAGDAVEPLRALRRRRADQTWDTGEKVAWLLIAASHPAEDAGAVALVEAALDGRPDHPVALAAYTWLSGREPVGLRRLAERLRAAAQAAEDPARRVVLAYRAARVWCDLGDEEAARALAALVAAGTGSTAAQWLVRTVSAGGASEAAHYRTVAASPDTAPERRHWAWFAAAVHEGDRDLARQDLEALLADSPGHFGGAHLLEVLLSSGGPSEALLDLFQAADGNDPAELVRNAVLLTEDGRTEEAVLVLRRLRAAPPGTPLRPAARAAVELGMAELAAEILAPGTSAEDCTERARLLAGLGRPQDALPLLLALSESGPDRIGVSARLATVAQQAGAHDAMISAYATLANESQSQSLRAAYGAWTAMQLHAAGRDRDALEPWRVALAERPSSTSALLGASRSLIARKDAEGLRRLFGMLRPEAIELLAETLYMAGDRAAAADALWRSTETDRSRRLASLLIVERLREEVAAPHPTGAAWQAAYDALSRRRELCRSTTALEDADARRRWILRERLANTEAAWELYRALHAESPDDPEVTEALARIAGARGETALAIGYLDRLASTATDSADAARYRRRIGEVQEAAGNRDAARQAYLDALDHLPQDALALGALRRLAEASGDWTAVVAILQRQVGTAPPERQLELRREIARVTEDHGGDALVAMDAWRAVLEQVPDDPEGLDRLMALASVREQWGVFVDAGQVRVRSLLGQPRIDLLRQLGTVSLDELGRDDGVRFLDEAATGESADLASVLRLEQYARSRADWATVVRMLLLQARLQPGRKERVDALLKAARIQQDALHANDDAAATYQQLLALDPDHEPALRFLAAWLYELGRAAEALPICAHLEPLVEKGQDLDDFDTRMELANFYYSFAEMLRKAGREEEAAARYARTLELNPSHLPSLEAVGPLYVSAEQWPRAEAVYRQLVQLSGGQGDKVKVATVYTQLGLVERRLGQQEKAYKRFSKALELQPNHVGALKGMALVLEDRADWSNLLNVYNNIIYHATQPEDVIDAYMTKGRVLDDQMQRQDKAAQHYQRSLDFDPAQPHAYTRLAELAMRRDAYKEAGELVDKAFGLDQDLVDPWRARLLVVRAAAWQDAGRIPEAERCLREARMLDAALVARMGENALSDLEGVRRAIKESLPTT